MTPFQAIVADRLYEAHDEAAVRRARETLTMAYAMIDRRLEGRTWAAVDRFTIADCAAAPSLFYASSLEPFGDGQRGLGAYFERLMARPSVVRTIREAGPYFQFYPFHDAIPARFLPATV
jgi:glutathione S-transferase